MISNSMISNSMLSKLISHGITGSIRQALATLFLATIVCFGLLAARADTPSSVLTQHNNNIRTGANPNEPLLTPANVTVTASPITGVGNAAPANVTVTTSPITGVGNVAAPLTGVPRRTP